MSDFILWGVELSPFVLKLQSCLHFAGKSYRRLPDQGGYLENIRLMWALESAKRQHRISRYPEFDRQLDEYPAVPYLCEDGKHFQYDSSAIARWLDQHAQARSQTLFPENPSLNFVASLIDEAFDEFGLYMVHHMRWVGSAKSTPMGKLLAHEFRHALPPGGPTYLEVRFPQRQVRRCPYLFSVAPKHYKSGVKSALTPPTKTGFPETHSLLNQCWKRYLEGMETVLSQQAYLLGDRFTIADASAYGQLAMNLVDPCAAKKMQAIAPLTFDWLNKIYRNEHVAGTSATGPEMLYLSPALKPLLNVIMGTFSALMIQNARAWKNARCNGETLFNEAAFDQGKALYDGQLRGHPFRSVVKTFQVRVWQELGDSWQKLQPKQKKEVRSVIDLCELFEA